MAHESLHYDQSWQQSYVDHQTAMHKSLSVQFSVTAIQRVAIAYAED